MIQPDDIVLTKKDKFKILLSILNDMVPWQIPTYIGSLMFITNVILLNNADWYQNIEHLRHVARFGICFVIGFLVGALLLSIFMPIVEKIEGKWDSFEREYRVNAVKKVDEFLLSSRRGKDQDED